MRIDYRPPRNLSNMSVSSGKQRSSGSSAGGSALFFVILAVIIFGGGFGTGWYFSQQSTKRAFRAAMEQKSLENSPKEERHPIPPPVPVTEPVSPAPSAQPAAAAPPAAPATAAAPAASQKPAPPPGLPLSFYENLPSGQKNTVLGSGINEKNKPAPPAAPPQQQPAAAAPPKPDAAPVAAPQKPAAATGGWLVQVAALSSKKEAEALKAKLVAKGYNASIMETHLNDKGTWYRVRIGRRMSKEAATDIASRIGGGAKALPDQE